MQFANTKLNLARWLQHGGTQYHLFKVGNSIGLSGKRIVVVLRVLSAQRTIMTKAVFPAAECGSWVVVEALVAPADPPSLLCMRVHERTTAAHRYLSLCLCLMIPEAVWLRPGMTEFLLLCDLTELNSNSCCIEGKPTLTENFATQKPRSVSGEGTGFRFGRLPIKVEDTQTRLFLHSRRIF